MFIKITEARYDGSGIVVPRGLMLTAETDDESAVLDEWFGTTLFEDGIIGAICFAQCRRSEGSGEHYVLIK